MKHYRGEYIAWEKRYQALHRLMILMYGLKLETTWNILTMTDVTQSHYINRVADAKR